MNIKRMALTLLFFVVWVLVFSIFRSFGRPIGILGFLVLGAIIAFATKKEPKESLLQSNDDEHLEGILLELLPLYREVTDFVEALADFKEERGKVTLSQLLEYKQKTLELMENVAVSDLVTISQDDLNKSRAVEFITNQSLPMIKGIEIHNDKNKDEWSKDINCLNQLLFEIRVISDLDAIEDTPATP